MTADFIKALAHAQMLSQIRILYPQYYILNIYTKLIHPSGMWKVLMRNMAGLHAFSVWEFKLVKLISSGSTK